MERQKRQGAEYEFYGKLPLKKAIPLGLQHVLAMFVGNLTPILIISGACGIAGEEFGESAGRSPAECDADRRDRDTDPVICDRTGWWKGTDHHGNEFRIYRCV